jgi:group I intron endonuclease
MFSGKNELTVQSGIYAIMSKTWTVLYIGSAKVFYNRWARHKKDLRKNKHHSSYLQRHYDKHGEHSLTFIIVDFCPDNLLLIKEQYFLDMYNPPANSAKRAGSPIGVKHSQHANEAKRKYALENNIRPPPPIKTPVVMLDRNTKEPIMCFHSMTAACIYCGKDYKWVSMIRDVLLGKRKTAFGYCWGKIDK